MWALRYLSSFHPPHLISLVIYSLKQKFYSHADNSNHTIGCVVEKSRLHYLLLRNNEDPLHFSLPSAMIAIRSPSRSASSLQVEEKDCANFLIKQAMNIVYYSHMKCVVRTMVLPLLLRDSKSQVARRA